MTGCRDFFTQIRPMVGDSSFTIHYSFLAMDLREANQATTGSRHPWELARVRALRAIARTYEVFRPEVKTLDLGCGDGFIIDELCAKSGARVDAVDINLTAEQIRVFAGLRPSVVFHGDYSSLPEKAYGLVTMFDVLEHVQDDTGFLREIVARFSQPGAVFFCTVPAFQSLLCAHDRFLGHHRRYCRSELHQVLGNAGLRVMVSGYLFASLLPVRAGMALVGKICNVGETEPGVGLWRRGQFVTSLVTRVLDADNDVLLWLSKRGITVPGLTVWAICEKPR